MAIEDDPSAIPAQPSISKLPIDAYEDEIVEKVKQNRTTIVIGATGSGKTTKIAQFLYRAGFAEKGVIGVTQPRRVAAVSVSRRVAWEMGAIFGEEVGYTIRFEDRTSSVTKINYMTDGCLLRECLSDPQLLRYSVIVLDEAHERSLNTDILFGLLKKLVVEREPALKLIITSATLDSKKFSSFFGNCPVVEVPGLLFPVEILHSTEKAASYFKSAIQTVMDIHTNRPLGDILVFLSGQEEIEKAVRALEETIAELEASENVPDAMVLPLHASLPPELQARVFSPPPPGIRRIIVATNIAETSVTVDGIVYVVDPGVVKQRRYDAGTGLDSLKVVPISRVQAIQRAGRAGRTRAGVCFRLYPKAVLEREMLPSTVPEIQRSSLTGTVLYLKSLQLAHLDVLKFDFLDRPSSEALEDALRQLYILGAIDADGHITEMGRQMAVLPLDPALARTLLEAESLLCLEEALSVAAMLACESTVILPLDKDKQGQLDPYRRELLEGELSGGGYGDHVRLLQIYEAWERARYSKDWCLRYGVQVRAMMQARDIRRQLADALKRRPRRPSEGPSGPHVPPPEKSSGSSRRFLRRALSVGFSCRLARRMPRHNGYKTLQENSQLVEIHPACAPLSVDSEGLLPEWLVYHEVVATSRAFMRAVCAVEAHWLSPTLSSLSHINLSRLSGSASGPSPSLEDKDSQHLGDHQGPTEDPLSKKRALSSVDQARARYLARKQAKAKK